MTPARGELWLADLGTAVGHEPEGRRPSLVVSNDGLNAGPAGLVMVVPLTTRERRLPNHVAIEPGATGLHRVSYAKCEDLRSVSQERLVHRIGAAPEGVMAQVSEILRHLLTL